MKKTLLSFLAGAIVVLGLSFKTLYEPKNNTAEVEQIEGLYIFTDSKPVKEYDFIGTSKSSMSMGSTQYTGIRDRLIKKVKKEFPTANAVILHFENGGTDKADAIKLK